MNYVMTEQAKKVLEREKTAKGKRGKELRKEKRDDKKRKNKKASNVAEEQEGLKHKPIHRTMPLDSDSDDE